MDRVIETTEAGEMKKRKAKIIGKKGPSHLNGGQNWMWRKKEGERKK